MGRLTDNFRKILEEANRRMEKELLKHLDAMTSELCTLAIENYKGKKMTGNAYNGLVVGCFFKGSLLHAYYSNDKIGRSPLRIMLDKGEKFFAGTIRYDNEVQRKTFEADVVTEHEYSIDTAHRFITSYKPKSKDRVVFVIVSSVNYSKYIESHYGYKVISGVHDVLKGMNAIVTEITG